MGPEGPNILSEITKNIDSAQNTALTEFNSETTTPERRQSLAKQARETLEAHNLFDHQNLSDQEAIARAIELKKQTEAQRES